MALSGGPAGRLVGEQQEEPPQWDWDRITQTAAKSVTKWVFVEAGSQWRNGIVEHQVACLKNSMSSVLETNTALNYAELETLFASTALGDAVSWTQFWMARKVCNTS